MAIRISNPIAFSDWDEQIRSFPACSFFHRTAWARVLQQSYGYEPCCFSAWDGSALTAAIPLMEVSSFLTGKRGVSLPFTDYCEPLVPHVETSKVLFDEIRREGIKRGWKYIEMRGGSEFIGEGPSSAWFYRHTLDLSPGEAKLFKSFRDSNRRNIKKANKEGVEVRFETTLEALQEFYRLNCLTRREHGLPPQPWHFFVNLHKEILSKGMGVVALGLFEGNAVAANIYLHSNGEAVYKYGASDKTYQHLRASNLVMWEAIRLYAGKGCKNLCFGRTEPENEGLRQFKTGWGTEESILHYYRYDLALKRFSSGRQSVSSAANKMFASMPLPALKAVGNLLYRHMG